MGGPELDKAVGVGRDREGDVDVDVSASPSRCKVQVVYPTRNAAAAAIAVTIAIAAVAVAAIEVAVATCRGTPDGAKGSRLDAMRCGAVQCIELPLHPFYEVRPLAAVLPVRRLQGMRRLGPASLAV